MYETKKKIKKKKKSYLLLFERRKKSARLNKYNFLIYFQENSKSNLKKK